MLEPGEYANVTGNTATAWGLIAAVAAERPAPLPRHLPDHPGLGHPPRALQAQAVRRAHLPGRGRDLRHRRRPRRRLRRRPRGHHHLRPRHRPEVGDDGPGHQPRAAAADHRHPAGRPLHRPAHQDRAGRPPPRHVRPPRRGAAADRGRQDPVPLLRGHPRGGPASPSSTGPRSSCCPTATWPTGPSRGGCPTSRTCPPSTPTSPPAPTTSTRTAPRSSGPTSATRRPWPGRGPPRAWPASSTASAASRSPTAPATSPTTAPTTSG